MFQADETTVPVFLPEIRQVFGNDVGVYIDGEHINESKQIQVLYPDDKEPVRCNKLNLY